MAPRVAKNNQEGDPYILPDDVVIPHNKVLNKEEQNNR
jgi:hypothetical protein